MYEVQTDGPAYAYLIAEMPEQERPRERLERCGAAALSDTELLAILLRNGRRGRSVLEVSRDLLRAFEGDLARLASAGLSEFRQVRGIGPAKAVELRAAFALAERLVARRGPQRLRVQGPPDVVEFMREKFRGKNQEEFHALLLGAKNHLIRDELVTLGLLDRSHVHAREVFRGAIRESCARILLVHNHPSGDPSPSKADICCTRKLAEAGTLLGIEVVDHIVVARPDLVQARPYLSFREEGLMK